MYEGIPGERGGRNASSRKYYRRWYCSTDLGKNIFPYIQENLDDIITIDDDELIVAFLDMVENHKMIVENSGLLTVAALRHLDVKNKKIVSILSGGNMDVITMSSVVQHGLIQRDRIFTVSVLIPDKPGELVRVASVIAENQGNVIKLDHNQFVSTNRNAAVELGSLWRLSEQIIRIRSLQLWKKRVANQEWYVLYCRTCYIAITETSDRTVAYDVTARSFAKIPA